MRQVWLAAMMAGAAGSAAAAELPEPLGPAGEGRLQCYEPDAARRTCMSLAGYAPVGGAIIETTSVLVNPDPLVVMRTAAPVQVEDGAICGVARRRYVETAAILVEGDRALSEVDAAPVRQQILTVVQPYLDRKICTTYRRDGDGWMTKATLDGTPQPALDQRMIWVSPGDGWRVGP